MRGLGVQSLVLDNAHTSTIMRIFPEHLTMCFQAYKNEIHLTADRFSMLKPT